MQNQEQVKVIEKVVYVQQSNKHGIPALLSFLCPGLGQLIKGHTMYAFLFFFFSFIGLIFFIIPGVVVYLMNIHNAYNCNKDFE
jgi:TM2 domain-containing membrane protein YozV